MIGITIECLQQKSGFGANKCSRLLLGTGERAATASYDHAFSLRGIY